MFTFTCDPLCLVNLKIKIEINFTLKDISMFSPPHTSMPSSYLPNSSKYDLSMENSPPAIVGELESKQAAVLFNESSWFYSSSWDIVLRFDAESFIELLKWVKKVREKRFSWIINFFDILYFLA